jgi:hypothetical protein
MGRSCSTKGEMRISYKILVENRERDLRGWPRRRWDNNIKMDLREIGCKVDWILLAQGRFQWSPLINT